MMKTQQMQGNILQSIYFYCSIVLEFAFNLNDKRKRWYPHQEQDLSHGNKTRKKKQNTYMMERKLSVPIVYVQHPKES